MTPEAWAQIRRGILIFILWPCLVVCIIVSLRGIYSIHEESLFYATAKSTIANITDVRKYRSHGVTHTAGKGTRTSPPQYWDILTLSFKDETGNIIKTKRPIRYPSYFTSGEKVSIYYDPAKPQETRIAGKERLYLWQDTLSLCITALLFFLISIIALTYWNKKSALKRDNKND